MDSKDFPMDKLAVKAEKFDDEDFPEPRKLLQENFTKIEDVKIENNDNLIGFHPESEIKEEINSWDEIKPTRAENNFFPHEDIVDPLSVAGTSYEPEEPQESPEPGFKFVNVEDIKLNAAKKNERENASIDRTNYTVTDTGREKCYSCNLCTLKCRYKSHIDRHMMQHTGERPYKCHLCSAKFTHRGNLNGHMRIHTGEKPYSCDVCSKQFREKSNVRRHMRIHTGEKPYVCEVCSGNFREKKLLDIHMRTHTGGFFACVTCDKKFKETGALKRHLRIHTRDQVVKTGNKRIICQICSLKFPNKSGLKKHMKVHEGELPFGCSLCSISFKTIIQLNKHLLIHNFDK